MKDEKGSLLFPGEGRHSRQGSQCLAWFSWTKPRSPTCVWPGCGDGDRPPRVPGRLRCFCPRPRGYPGSGRGSRHRTAASSPRLVYYARGRQFASRPGDPSRRQEGSLFSVMACAGVWRGGRQGGREGWGCTEGAGGCTEEAGASMAPPTLLLCGLLPFPAAPCPSALCS